MRMIEEHVFFNVFWPGVGKYIGSDLVYRYIKTQVKETEVISHTGSLTHYPTVTLTATCFWLFLCFTTTLK